jgi:hypothetical protein
VPRALGWILVVGGVGYVLSTLQVPRACASGLAAALPLAAKVGEVWMVGYLLIKGMPEGPPVPMVQVPGS